MRFDTYHFISLTLLLSGKILAADPVNEAGRRQVFDPTITKPTITKTYIPSISWLSRSTSTPEPVTTSTKKTTTSTSTQKSSTSTSKPYYPPTSTTLKTSTTSSKTSTGGEVGPTSSKCPVPLYYQCGGATWTGCKTCEKGSYCKTQNEFYYQCVAEE
ncbi:carbohydrate-binding module family 1 protein [Patellaria atrata CBS 101060]|uniref:Carbohydrate-binding module family 1 protein n=1 Tax=Patellaria atrata CBS 101060 TaxID=1346257 RepID=A0A9P4S1C1_9PEZI|nr:carbohydrate-binding module family 1 protein [Patellaria atrata CBS 101060]